MTEDTRGYAPTETWDLDCIVPEGPAGKPFLERLKTLGSELKSLIARADALPVSIQVDAFAGLLLDFEQVLPKLEELLSYAGCSAAAAAADPAANRADQLANDLYTQYSRAWVVPNQRLSCCSDLEFAALLSDSRLGHMRGMLQEIRDQRRFRMSEQEEALYAELSRDGVLAWGQLYDTIVGSLKIPVDKAGDGSLEEFSPGQVFNLLHSDDRALRLRAFGAWQKAWKSVYPTCAAALTHITGTRATLNARRKLDPLEEPLAGARIERSTLEAILSAARANRPRLHRYLALKAKRMGREKLDWHDTYSLLGKSGGNVSYGDAQHFIVEQFRKFSPALADYSVRAFSNRWIEVEDRPGKRGGGFCTGVPLRQETRIFMTWGGSESNVATLAHELGHAFHAEVLFREPISKRRLPMTLAETASTFGEALVREAALAGATDPEHRLRLLDDALTTALAYLCNIPARLELELALYRLREKGPLDPVELELETERIFGEWYGPIMEQVDSTFWANKLHFYIGGMAFYNFPYIFGYLFSALVYEHFAPQGPAGAPGYERLLARTGDESAEKIAREELGLDLSQPETWAKAMQGVERWLTALEGLGSAH
jgi:pepF/M3 family oligoendopeptidase